jgi:hypothetical protein
VSPVGINLGSSPGVSGLQPVRDPPTGPAD